MEPLTNSTRNLACAAPSVDKLKKATEKKKKKNISRRRTRIPTRFSSNLREDLRRSSPRTCHGVPEICRYLSGTKTGIGASDR
ncbi:hypothetical protein HZH68_005155 [Vespula germanica]|uniref:Uncharacterized protein n=1 Tax=Vespula germanica TaxID=30212 RepID=A0A834KFF6_VESGE|nr:hypothetical protein HZH68_005155 [Vespula germanica]